MNLQEAKTLAITLMDKHGLLDSGWYFEFDNAKRRFGCCKFRTKRITLSRPLVSLNVESEVKDTILHEIAHALVGHLHGHDSVWRRKALEIGCNGERCYSSAEVIKPESKYIAKCGGCGKVYAKHKRARAGVRSSCGKCSGGRYNDTYRLDWVANPNY